MWANYFGNDIDIPEGGLFKTVRTAEDAQHYLDLPCDRPDDVNEAWQNVISGESVSDGSEMRAPPSNSRLRAVSP